MCTYRDAAFPWLALWAVFSLAPFVVRNIVHSHGEDFKEICIYIFFNVGNLISEGISYIADIVCFPLNF